MKPTPLPTALTVIILCLTLACKGGEPHSPTLPLTIVEYNCENLFDTRHDSLCNDLEFLPDGQRHWTFSRYWRKLNDIGRVIQQCGESGDRWRLPDLVTLVEVENDSTMLALTRRSMLRGAGYRHFITQSTDPRGVDVALLYNPLTFAPTAHASLRVIPPDGDKPTRDILYVKGHTRSHDTLHVLVVHAPSRSGGQHTTEPYRLAVAARLNAAIDSIRQSDQEANIILAGDFNDYSHDTSLRTLCANGMVNASAEATGHTARGTYKHQGRWGSLDHILVSHSLLHAVKECRIHDAPWMMQPDKRGGSKPRRTYLGTFYQGGVSDHLPLVLTLQFSYK